MKYYSTVAIILMFFVAISSFSVFIETQKLLIKYQDVVIDDTVHTFLKWTSNANLLTTVFSALAIAFIALLKKRD